MTNASLSRGSFTLMLVLLALCGAIAARMGSELAARLPMAFAGRVNAAPLVWWLAVALSVGGAIGAVFQHRSFGRWYVVGVVVVAGHGAAL